MAMVWGAYLRDENTCARTSAENVGGAYTRGGAYMRDATVFVSVYMYLWVCVCICEYVCGYVCVSTASSLK